MSNNVVALDARTYLLDQQQFANVGRVNVLGLRNAPMVQMDDGTYRAYFGSNVPALIASASTGETGAGTVVALPLDVKSVGYEYLSQFGYTADQQTFMFSNWRAMPSTERAQYTSNWDALNMSDSNAVQAFVTGLAATLSASNA